MQRTLKQYNMDLAHSTVEFNEGCAFSAVDLNSDGSILTFASALRGPQAAKWLQAYGEEIVRLCEHGDATFISRADVPKGKIVTYSNPQTKIKMKDGELVYRVRITIGGDRLPYDPTSAQVAILETIRVLLNSIVSDKANFLCADIKDYYLGTRMNEPEYMSISLKHIPIEIQNKYGLQKLARNGSVVMRIGSTIYGLKAAGRLSQDRLIAHLAENGYHQAKHSPCLFVHKSNGVAFTLVVDDFLVKYQTQESIDHFTETLRKLYVITVDTALKQKYVGITIDYNKAKGYMDLSMPGYVTNALTRFNKLNVKGANSPIVYTPPVYGAKSQTIPADGPPASPLTDAHRKTLQEIIGVFLYYARAVDPMMLPAVNKLGSRQATADSSIFKDTDRLFQYASRWRNAVTRIKPSDMQLYVHSDASYLSESKSRSRAGGFMYLGQCKTGGIPNAPVCYLSTIISTVVDSAAAAEYAALFINAQAATSIRQTLEALGYHQTPTIITCDNKCAVGISNKSFTQKRSKTIDMRYHWIQDQIELGNFAVIWEAGKFNLADFFTKAHPVSHHVNMMNTYLVPEEGVLIS
jgi:hypothetical protein